MIHFKINEENSDIVRGTIVLQSNKIKDSLEYLINKRGEEIENEDYDSERFSIQLEEISDIAGSCGITSFDCLNNLAEFLLKHNSLCSKNIKLVIDYLIQNTQVSIILFSTNEQYPQLIPIMDKLCDFKSKSIININSRNTIKLWGFYNPKTKFLKRISKKTRY